MLYIGLTDIAKRMGGGKEVVKVMDVRQLVNGPLSPAGIPADNALGWGIVVENFTVALEASLLGQLSKILDYLSALGFIHRYNSEPKRGWFFYNIS